MQSAVDFNGQETKWSYDLNDNVRNITNVKAHNNLDVNTWFEYDDNENLKVIRNAKGIETRLDYDFDTDLLQSYSFEDSQKTYAYNDDGSLKTFTDPGGHTFSYQYDEQDRLKDDGYAAYDYDDQGRLEKVTKDGKNIQFSCDDFHRISQISYDDFSNTVGLRIRRRRKHHEIDLSRRQSRHVRLRRQQPHENRHRLEPEHHRLRIQADGLL